jgi:chromosome segregation ATPase
LFLADSNAQRRRRKRRSNRPRITNPAIYQPVTGEGENSNSAATTGTDDSTADRSQKPSQSAEDPDAMKQTIRTLSGQVDKLSQKLGQMEESQRSLLDLERLSRAEQRSASLHAELRDLQAKQADIEAKTEDIDFALKPENIERAVAGYGSTHPEEVREQRRKQLENEKERVKKQLDQLRSGQARLEQAIASADIEVENLHKRIDASDAAAIQNAKTKAQANGSSSSDVPIARPSPSPYPPQ